MPTHQLVEGKKQQRPNHPHFQSLLCSPEVSINHFIANVFLVGQRIFINCQYLGKTLESYSSCPSKIEPTATAFFDQIASSFGGFLTCTFAVEPDICKPYLFPGLSHRHQPAYATAADACGLHPTTSLPAHARILTQRGGLSTSSGTATFEYRQLLQRVSLIVHFASSSRTSHIPRENNLSIESLTFALYIHRDTLPRNETERVYHTSHSKVTCG